MFAHVNRQLLAAPLVALLGAAMMLAAWPDGAVTSRERALVAQRLETDGGQWSADAVDLAEARLSARVPTCSRVALASARTGTVPATSARPRLDAPACRGRAGRAAASPALDRAPPHG